MAKTTHPMLVCMHCGGYNDMHVKLMGLISLVLGILLILPTMGVMLFGPQSHFIAVALLGLVIALKGVWVLAK